MHVKQVKECALQAVLLEISSQVETETLEGMEPGNVPRSGRGGGRGAGRGRGARAEARTRVGAGTAGQVDVAHGAKILVPTHGCATLDFACRNLSFVINKGRRFYPPCPFR